MTEIDLAAVVRAVLLEAPAVSALVGTRIYPPTTFVQAPARPFIVSRRVSTTYPLGLRGEPGIGTTRVSLSCWWDEGSQSDLPAVVKAVFSRGWGGDRLGRHVNLIKLDSDVPADDPVLKLVGRHIDVLVLAKEGAAA